MIGGDQTLTFPETGEDVPDAVKELGLQKADKIVTA